MAENLTLIELTADIVSSHVANNSVSVGDMPRLIEEIHGALASLGQPAEEPKQKKMPVVTARASIKPDYIVCMECGQKQKTLKRHLQKAHGLTPDQYRAEFGLPRDYPMVAPAYSKRRSEMAHSIGLGRKQTGKTGTGAGGKAKPKRGRKPKASASTGE